MFWGKGVGSCYGARRVGGGLVLQIMSSGSASLVNTKC